MTVAVRLAPILLLHLMVSFGNTVDDLTFIQHIVISYYLKDHMFYSSYDTSFKQCHKSCLARAKCVSYNYIRRVKKCELNDSDKTVNPSDYEHRPESVYNQIADWSITVVDSQCSDCEETEVCEVTSPGGVRCVTLGCPESALPQINSGGTFLGNQVTIGSKRAATCNTGVLLGTTITSECLSTGNWSEVDIVCGNQACINPSPPDHLTLTKVTIQDGTISGHFTCSNSGYRMQGEPLLCNINNGNYRYSLLCCDEETGSSNFIRIYRAIADNGTPILDFYHNRNNNDNCEFRDFAFFDQWNEGSVAISKITLKLYNQTQEVAWVEFNGTNTNKNNWFLMDNYLGSSWPDLDDAILNNEVEEFSMGGHMQMRFMIVRNLTDECGVGWMMVAPSWACGNRNPDGLMIPYATSSYIDFNDTATPLASKYEIYVTLPLN